jgi:hypothetical protein
MSTTSTASKDNPVENELGGDDIIESVAHVLGECRTRIDELLVQLDLAKLDIREEVSKRMSVAQNAYLAAKSKVADAKPDVDSAFTAVHQSAERVLRDLALACKEVDAVVKRARASDAESSKPSPSH